jgi:hypothetical protein
VTADLTCKRRKVLIFGVGSGFLAKAGKGYVLAVPVNFQVRLPSGRKAAVSAVAALVPASAWETRSCGRGCKGHRDYGWAWAATASPGSLAWWRDVRTAALAQSGDLDLVEGVPC